MAVIEFESDFESVIDHIKVAQESEQNIDFFINNINIRCIDMHNLDVYDKEEEVLLMMMGDTDYLIEYLEDFRAEGGLKELEDVSVKGIKVGYETGDDEVVWFEPELVGEGMIKEETFIELAEVIEEMREDENHGKLVFANPLELEEEET